MALERDRPNLLPVLPVQPVDLGELSKRRS
jgi:hypothetical protein